MRDQRQFRALSRFLPIFPCSSRFSRALPSSPPRKRGPRNRDGAAAAERASAQRVLRRRGVRVSLKSQRLPAGEAVAARCPFGCHPELRGLWLPAFAGKTKRVGKRGPRSRDGAAAAERASAQRVLRRRGVRASLKRQRPPCRGGRGGPMSFWLPARARRFPDPGPRLFCRGGKTEVSVPLQQAAGSPGGSRRLRNAEIGRAHV